MIACLKCAHVQVMAYRWPVRRRLNDRRWSERRSSFIVARPEFARAIYRNQRRFNARQNVAFRRGRTREQPIYISGDDSDDLEHDRLEAERT